MTMWVWRLPPEDGYYNDPTQMQHDEQFYKQSTHPNPQQYVSCNFKPIKIRECRTWVINEIFNQQKLRQGWCGIDLDINLPKAIWMRNYQLIDPNKGSLAEVERRYKILSLLLVIRAGDTVFLPRVGNNQLSYDDFTVVTAAGSYYFENRSRENMYWKRDYGHVIPVDGNLTRTFPYSQTTLQSGDFGAPFLKCLVKVPDHRFYQFLKNQNYPFIP